MLKKVLQKTYSSIFLLLIALPCFVNAETIPWMNLNQAEKNPEVSDSLKLKFTPDERNSFGDNGLEYYTAGGGENRKYYHEWVAFVDSGKVVFQQQGRFIWVDFSRKGKTMFAVTYEQNKMVYYYYREGKSGVIKAPSYGWVKPEDVYFVTHTYYGIDDDATRVVNGSVGDGSLASYRICDEFENCYKSTDGVLNLAFLTENRFAELHEDEVIVYQDNTEAYRIDLNQEIEWRNKREGSFHAFDNTLIVLKREQLAWFDLDTGLFVWQFDSKGSIPEAKRLHKSYFKDGYLVIPFRNNKGLFRRGLDWR